MTRRRQHYSKSSSFSKNLKDYIVPIIGFILIVGLFYSCFKKENVPVQNTENQTGITIVKDAESKADIYYLNGTKKSLDEVQKLFRGEKISVASGTVKLQDEKADFNLDKRGELKYLENGEFSMTSGDIWIDSKSSFNLDMKFAKLKIHENSHISLSQNEVNSTVQVVSGMVEVSNLKGRNVVLTSMETITINNSQASDEKLTLKKEAIGDIFLKDNWFLLNKGNDYINTGTTEENNTGTTVSEETSTGNISKNTDSGKNKFITFSNLVDESNVSSSTILVFGAYDTEEISKIELNGKVAVLNSTNGTFRIEGVSVGAKENDLVFKVFDADENLKEKFVYTVYNESGSNETPKNTESSEKNVFSVDAEKFTFTAPSASGTYTTNEGFVTIRGTVLAKNITKVEVNGLKLSSFNGKTWRYHASVDYGNFVDGTNQYEVKYYSGNDLVYKNYFTIVKKSGASAEANSNNSIAY